MTEVTPNDLRAFVAAYRKTGSYAKARDELGLDKETGKLLTEAARDFLDMDEQGLLLSIDNLRFNIKYTERRIAIMEALLPGVRARDRAVSKLKKVEAVADDMRGDENTRLVAEEFAARLRRQL